MMHHPRCLDPDSRSGDHPIGDDPEGCRFGREGHCRMCPERGQRDPRAVWAARLESLAAAVANGYPVEQILVENPDEAAMLWPVGEREWIGRDSRWAERAAYWASMHTQKLIKDLLRDLHDARAALTAAALSEGPDEGSDDAR